MATDVLVPDLGDFKDVEVIDVLVKPGDRIEAETPLITLETEKATMDVPSSSAGVVKSVAVKKGDRVSKGSVVVTVEAGSPEKTPTQPSPASGGGEEPEPAASSSGQSPVASSQPPSSFAFDLVVLGAGPGGYTAAFRAADLGMKVAMIERWPTLGGVCLNVGCIPSKALLHAAKVIEEAEEMHVGGITFGKPQIDLAKLREWKGKVVGRLTGGLAMMSKQRKVEIIRGTGRFVSPHEIEVAAEVTGDEEQATGDRRQATARKVSFRHCIIAAGSESIKLPGLPDDPRIIDSTGALEIDIPKRFLVVGGGIIGLEMATVYAALGAQVSVVELTDGLIPGCDRDLVRPLEKRIAKKYEQILVKTRVTKIEALEEGLKVTFEGEKAPGPQLYDKVLIAVGRSPNGKRINAEAAGVQVNERGFIPVDRQMRTNVPHIFAIGDIVGQPML
ncbi:MAG TPA: FAD-dependent oxidoreductase, partial [Povalibacter sp.]|uniref:FAD-dependent oxidoreductase n=1 Tax=Povalibacter sp. TaxID=1962978 RepID=UPI002C0B4CED